MNTDNTKIPKFSKVKPSQVCRSLTFGILILTLGIGIFYIMFYSPLQKKQQFTEQRMAECIEKLAEYANSLNPNLEYSIAQYHYNKELDLCLFRGSFVTTSKKGHYFEKFIVNVFTGETLAKYTEFDGVPIIGDINIFSYEIDRLF